MYIGVDGCRGGWFAVGFDGHQYLSFTAPHFAHVARRAGSGGSVLIDIPIGLRDDDGTPRRCDVAARQWLRPGATSSVFPAPVRMILGETDHGGANARSRALTGKGISQQAFHIMAKIRQVDGWLARSTADVRVREAHPEVCFRAFAEQRPLQHRKKTLAGYEERLAILERVMPAARQIAQDATDQFPRSVVARDDVADALVLLATALAPGRCRHTLPPIPETDSRGLPMEIVYALPGPGWSGGPLPALQSVGAGD